MAIKDSRSQDKLQDLKKRREVARLGGGQERIDAQHQRGKLTARERIAMLLDDGSFEELDVLLTQRPPDSGQGQEHPAEAVVTGYGLIEGRPVYVFSQDFTVVGGSLSEAVSTKICKVMDLALKTGAPIIGINDSGGARIQDGVTSLRGYGDIFLRNVQASGVIPQVSVIMGPCAGGAVYSPALTDFVFMVEGTGQMYITGPDVIRAVTGEEISHEDLGGAAVHAGSSGVAHFAYGDEELCLSEVRRLIGYLPGNTLDDAPSADSSDDDARSCDELASIVPIDPSRPYDVHEVITNIIDQDCEFLEVHARWAQNIVVGFGRMGGQTVGIVANNPTVLAGVLDIDSARKGSRFVRFCDAFNIPIVTLVDVPGYLPGADQEYGGIIAHGAKLIYAYAEASVPKVTCIIRKAYGGAYIVMGSKHLRTDINYAWPTAEIAVMGPEGAVDIVSRREIAAAADPDAKRRELTEEYREKFANPYIAAARGFIDDVIEPAETRTRIVRALAMLRNKADHNQPKKHDNLPL